MKAVIIARVSTEEQREAGNSLPAQITRLERYCQNKGFEIIKKFSFDESAYTDDRVKFDQAMKFIEEQKEKVAVCFDKVDRFSRNTFDTRIKTLYDKARKGKLELHFASDGQTIDNKASAPQKFQFKINLGLSEYYSDAVSDAVMRAQEEKVRKGEWLSKAPIGYRNIRLTEKIGDVIIDTETGPIVQEAYNLYATGAYSLDSLREKLYKEFGVKWLKGTLGKMLSNPFYHGTMIINGIAHQHRYAKLISKELFDDVQKVKNGFNTKPRKIVGVPKYIYRGVLRCAHCDLSITPEQHKGFIYYHCTQYNGKHNAAWLREEAITEQLCAAFKSFQIPADMLNMLVESLTEVHKGKMDFHNKQLDLLTRELKTTTGMLDNLYIDKLKNRISDEQYDRFHGNLRAKLDETNARLAGLQGAEENYYLTTRYILELAHRAYDLFVSSEVEERRQLINLVLQNVRIEGKNVVWDVQKPFNLLVKTDEGDHWRG